MNDNMRELLQEADKRCSEWRLDDAIRLYEEAVSRNPGQRHAVNRLAYCYALQGHIKKLIETCLKWQTYLAEGEHYELAKEVVKAILSYDPGSVDGRICLLEEVRASMSEDDYVEELNNTVNYFVEIDAGSQAVKVLHMAQEAFPTNVDIAIKLADVLMSEGDIQQAIQSYRNIIAELESSGESLKAVEIYRRLEVLTPDDSSLMMRLAEIYLGNEQYADAAREFRNALRVEYNDPVALCGLGNALVHMKDYNGAVLSCRKAVVIDPANFEASALLAKAYVKLGNVGDAIKVLLSAGSNLVACEDYEEAVRMYEAVLELYPSHSVAIRELSNAKDGVARKKAREEQILKMQLEAQKAKKAAAKAKAAKAKPAASTPYGIAAEYKDRSDFADVMSELEALAADGEPASLRKPSLHKPIEDEDEDFDLEDEGLDVEDEELESEEAAGDNEADKVTRILLRETPEGEIYDPVPFVVAKYADMIPLIQQIITQAPSREVFGWNLLPELESKNVGGYASGRSSAQSASKSSASQAVSSYNAAKVEGGPIRSAFGDPDAGGSLFSSGSSGFGGFSAASSGSGSGGLFGGGTVGVKSLFNSSGSSMIDNSSDEQSKSGSGGLSFLERIQMQQKQKKKS